VSPTLKIDTFRNFKSVCFPSDPIKKTKRVEEKPRLAASISAIVPKSTKLCKNRPLSLRTDVMNKNFFRAFRRELKAEFNAFIVENNYSKGVGKRTFRGNLNKFAAHFIESSRVAKSHSELTSEPDFIETLGVLINSVTMKKILTEKAQSRIAAVNDLLNLYSHKKFEEYTNLPAISLIMMMLFEKVQVWEMMSHHPALETNKEVYAEHIQKIIDSRSVS